MGQVFADYVFPEKNIKLQNVNNNKSSLKKNHLL